ncbi:copper amine oxidase N-terminal domain-containing protein [Paenibacillus daejeonensis]|uniref:copper amine oxidase N-terminal domain-containing protein n=1 Tax=Paenibacillus daejeonensis TaxID=135193 RepID=UPI0003618F46|nr:copper amine oxidase N-terminal domain-containing protein [Paenibacillus daejeonensis]
MKKTILSLTLAASLALSSATAFAATYPIQIDGVTLTSEVKPEMKNDRLMVPLRVISENLGATVDWTTGQVTLTKNDLKITLSLADGKVMKNGAPLQVDAKPYLSNDRLLVPIRLIAEAFGAGVNYKDGQVSVQAPSLKIDGVPVASLLYEYRMIMGGVVQDIHGSANREALYHYLTEHLGEKVEAPEHYAWHALIDNPGAYQQFADYEFVDKDGKKLAGFGLYARVQGFPEELIKDLPGYLVHDTVSNEWFALDNARPDAIRGIIERAQANGFVTVISNDAV